MFLFVRVCVILVALCSTLAAIRRPQTKGLDQKCTDLSGKCLKVYYPCEGSYVSGICGGPRRRKCCIPAYTAGSRRKRSPIKIGTVAVEALLRHAKFVYSNGRDSIYRKRGGLNKALTDFYSVSPENVRDVQQVTQGKILKVGDIGDRRLTIDISGSNPATITISKRPNRDYSMDKNPLTAEEIIVYTD